MGVSQYRCRFSRKVVARSIRRSTQAASTGVGTALVPQVEAAPLFSHFFLRFRRSSAVELTFAPVLPRVSIANPTFANESCAT
jgi:hypothetical protein